MSIFQSVDEVHGRAESDAPALPPLVGSILLVDDDPGTVQVLARMLAGMGHLRLALSANDALQLAKEAPPDVVLVDAEMPAMDGFEFCRRMKAEPLLAEVPVIIVTNHGDVATEVAGFAAGAADFIRKPPAAEVVQARVRGQLRLKRLTDALREAALTDALTGIRNRRSFDQDLQAECARARRSGQTLSLLMIDVDHFKRYNDRYGHSHGDQCLRRVAEALQATLHRPADSVARYGGEEFAVLLPDTDLIGALHISHCIIQAIVDLRIAHLDSALGGVVTVSVGAAAARGKGDGTRVPMAGAALISAADKALYGAKELGRGQCCTFPHMSLATPAQAR